MKFILIALLALVEIIPVAAQAQKKSKDEVYKENEEIFGKSSGFIFNCGLSAWGPEVTFGGVLNETCGEWYFIYHLFDYESNENLWNKPTSGGFLLGFNIVFNYGTENRFKYIIGFGSQLLKERLGKEAYYSRGDPKDGYFQGYELHGGLRYFITKHLFLTGWLGLFVSQDKSQTMLNKKPEYGTEEFSILTLDLALMYEF
ncbi:MAG: hypothetical protein HRF52_13495 [Ignavibacterium sp.]|jgi:hypothetical protein|uniref:hypothetical protein n=1 Tax=Ignavibacterium sp. TaxID=2651167 RepID=UPI003297E74E